MQEKWSDYPLYKKFRLHWGLAWGNYKGPWKTESCLQELPLHHTAIKAAVVLGGSNRTLSVSASPSFSV